jgi:hypothetical protein
MKNLWRNRALYHAFLGNVDEQAHAAAEARSRMSTSEATTGLVLHDTVLAARTGRFAEVLTLTGTAEAVPMLRNLLLRVLRAWALVATAPEASREEVRMLLDGARPVPPAALRFATEQWPELRAFLVEYGLTEAL